MRLQIFPFLGQKSCSQRGCLADFLKVESFSSWKMDNWLRMKPIRVTYSETPFPDRKLFRRTELVEEVGSVKISLQTQSRYCVREIEFFTFSHSREFNAVIP